MQSGTFGTLTRQAYFPWGTFGILTVGGRQWAIVEQPWRNNEPFRSCVPEGSFECVSHKSPRFGQCFALVGDGVGINQGDGHRWGILIHSANWPDQLQGCLAPGKSLQPIPAGGREWPQSLGVTQSRQAMQEMISELPDFWHLSITSIKATYASSKVA